MQITPSPKKCLGLGLCFKSLETGEVIEMKTKGKEFGKRPGIAVAHVKDEDLNRMIGANMILLTGHVLQTYQRKRHATALPFKTWLNYAFSCLQHAASMAAYRRMISRKF